MVLSTIGMILAAGAIDKMIENKGKNAYPGLDNNEFDRHNAVYGINIYDINKIAARNGVRCDQYGVLPENGWYQCIEYVKQYANTVEDVNSFPKIWEDTIEIQLQEKQIKIQNKAKNKYKNVSYEATIKQYEDIKNNPIIIVQFKHWYGLTYAEHMKRLTKITKETKWGHIAATKPILRPIPGKNGHLEIWQAYGLRKNDEQNNAVTMNILQTAYEISCEYCGYDPQL